MNELKPCPFCGGEAHTYHNNLWHVGCENALNGCVTMSAFVTEAEAIDAWNARVDFEFGGIPCTEENMKAHGWIREQTCRVESVSLIDWWEYTTANYYEFEMECGGGFKWDWREPPDYCPNCGGRVEEEK